MSKEIVTNILSTSVIEERTAELDKEIFVYPFKRAHSRRRLSFIQGQLGAHRALDPTDLLAMSLSSKIIV